MARMTVLLAVLAALATAVLVSAQGAQHQATCARRLLRILGMGMCRPAFSVEASVLMRPRGRLPWRFAVCQVVAGDTRLRLRWVCTTRQAVAPSGCSSTGLGRSSLLPSYGRGYYASSRAGWTRVCRL